MHKIPQDEVFDDLDLIDNKTQTVSGPILVHYVLQDYINDECPLDYPGYGCEKWILSKEYYCDPKNYDYINKVPDGYSNCAGKLGTDL